ncbi:MAG: tyrosine-type recombinase/integrase [Burkholderiales bacterium]
MSAVKIGSITIIVNGYTLNNNVPYFQKAIPSALKLRMGKSNVKIRLLIKNGNFAVQCHRLNERYDTLFRAMNDDERLTPSEAKIAAFALLQTHGLTAGDGLDEMRMSSGWEGSWDSTPHVSFFEDELREKFDKPTAVTNAAFSALYNKLPVLLSEAFTVYLENHPKGKDKDFQSNQSQHWRKLVALVGDIALEGLTRNHARQYRDQRLDAGVKTTTLLRELGVLRAVVNVACREIPLNLKNPFESLSIPNVNKDASKRIPYSKDEWKTLVHAAVQADDEPRRIALVLAFTGARLAEIVGLRKQDFDPVVGTINIRSHASRPLKTTASERIVPLMPAALNALQTQMNNSTTDFLFPAYANAAKTNNDGASATLSKWGKKFVATKTMHSFRHTFRDSLRAVMCPESIAKEIGGWSSTHDVSVGYGQGYPIELKRKWLTKAYSKLN